MIKKIRGMILSITSNIIIKSSSFSRFFHVNYCWLKQKAFNRKPYFYGILYLLLIPLFAVIYMLHYNEFYQSTTNQDGTAELMNKDMAEYISKRLAEAEVISHKIIKGASIAIEIHKITPRIKNEGKVQIHFEGSLQGGSEIKAVRGEVRLEENSSSPSPMIIFSYSEPAWTAVYLDKPIYSMKVDYSKKSFVPLDKELLSLVTLDDEVNVRNAISKYVLISKGQPSDMGYVKMLYFSVVTITTLGYGDIVPLSDTTRLLVSLESVLGIILIGLFLNAVAEKANNSSNPSGAEKHLQ